jgi:Trk K+ transport system NAD-binding subunit
VPVLIADIRLTETLETLHVAQARSLVVVTSSDIVNLEAALNAKALNPDLRVVLRLFDPDLAARVERAFGIHISRSPSALAAPAFAAAAEGERVLATISVGIPVLVVARVRVDVGCQAERSTVTHFEERTRSRVLLLTADGRQHWRPSGDWTLTAGQELVAVVTRSGLARVLANTEVELTSHLPKQQRPASLQQTDGRSSRER